ncbi:ferredoxin [Pseudogemmobacter blasticus]|uniref:Ferredoxin n=1 Tax=Fuscovulum blasticum DSM 2131 TaxID=1188250 RepID=A0A2T4J746_FUSBL|nr:ferredoxin [Fuscovulum blasticum]PTE13647.1 ferredoxin [Fuscovulum blasticum DSM 2131]
MTPADLDARLSAEFLEILGGFAVAEGEEGFPPGTRTVLLLGPREPGFWPHLLAQPEWDGAPDPVDRWSRRVVGRLACDLGAKALFPFGGPPYHPFYAWALRTGRCWPSPVRLLVHASQGMLVSIRGALALRDEVAVPPPVAQPCETCAAPCRTACPAGALGAAGYDLPACHGWLDTDGADCLTGGCLVRRACPVSATYARMPEQSAYHMRQFHR